MRIADAAHGFGDWIVGNRIHQSNPQGLVAVTFSAATNISSARPLPTSRGNRCVPPQPVISPKAAPRCPKTAWGEAIR